MDFLTALKDTPIPTLLVIGGLLFLFVGIATIKKPIIIEVTASSRRSAVLLGILLLIVGNSLYLLPTPASQQIGSTETPIATDVVEPVLSPTNTALNPAVTQPALVVTDSPTQVLTNGFENCIDSAIWTPYTVNAVFPKENACWNLSSRGITAYSRELFIAVKNASEQSGSIYTSLRETGTISFDLQIDKFNIGGKNGNLVFGLGNRNGWLQSGKFIFLRVTEPNSPIYYVYGNSVTRTGETVINSYKLGLAHRITFEIKGLILNIYINDQIAAPSVTLSPADKEVFWIGYRLPQSSELVASISNFAIGK